MSSSILTRRSFLARSMAIGCSAAASPWMTPVTLAAAPGDARLVVIVLRGAMDGLDIVQPWGDPDYAALGRAALGPAPGAEGGARPLSGMFALHPALGGLMPLWEAGQLGFVHAVSTPYRDARSHFTGQDILETGAADKAGSMEGQGWVNRLIQSIGGATSETAWAVGSGEMLLTRGPAPVSDWSPDAGFSISAAGLRRMEAVMHDDPLFRDSFARAIGLSGLAGLVAGEGAEMNGPDMSGSEMAAAPGGGAVDPSDHRSYIQAMREIARASGVTRIASFAADRLRGDARIATFSLGGWDTHAAQARTIVPPLGRLETAILTLREELGDVWDRTGVVAITEFGRTAALNGSGGTDHGTAGAMVTAGGAFAGGRVFGEWPGLAEADLYKGRDLMPTRDMRAWLAWILHAFFGVEKARLEREIFAGLDMGANPRLIL